MIDYSLLEIIARSVSTLAFMEPPRDRPVIPPAAPRPAPSLPTGSLVDSAVAALGKLLRATGRSLIMAGDRLLGTASDGRQLRRGDVAG